MFAISNLYVAEEYKNKIINLLYRNNDFITLINPTPSKCPDLDIIDVLNGGEWIINGQKWQEKGHVFDYNFVDETIEDERTFVFVETDINTIRQDIFTDFNLYVCIFTNKKLVRLTSVSIPTAEQVKEMGYFATSAHGNRIGALCDCVDRILNGTDKIHGIGNIKPASRGYMTIYIPNKKYYGKCLKYNITNYNPGGNTCGY